MGDLAHAFDELNCEEHQDVEQDVNELQREVPFRPQGTLANSFSATPRFLFRVYSRKSAGENGREWMRSAEAVSQGPLMDIFARRDSERVAVTLNKHLRWLSYGSYTDPFISWTTSFLFAIQYAIFKHKRERLGLQDIYICIVDTLEFGTGVFVRDLDLMTAFLDENPSDHQVIVNRKGYTWQARGLQDFCNLRSLPHKAHGGVYYYGEYLAQGQIDLKGRSSTVSCDKIINRNFFTLCPGLREEFDSSEENWANAVNKYRRVFHQEEEGPVVTNDSEMSAATLIMLKFDSPFQLSVMANLLALRPRRSKDTLIMSRIPTIFAESMRHDMTYRETIVVADESIPEVLQFKGLVEDIQESYREDITNTLGKIENIGVIVRRFLGISSTSSTVSSATIRRLQDLERKHLRVLEDDLVGIIRGIL